MKALLSAVKVAALVSLVLACTLGGTLWLFFHVATPELHTVLTRLHAYEGVQTARAVEELLEERRVGPPDDRRNAGDALDDPAIRAVLERDRQRLGLSLTLVPLEPGAPTVSPAPDDHHDLWPSGRQTIAGRDVAIEGGPRGRVWIPVLRGDAPVATLAVGGAGHAMAVHTAFRRGVGYIGLATLVGVLLVTAYLIKPLRRMRRSMDRIAAGDLDHRVAVRGRDEVAAMGRSFNTMADRIGVMVQGQKELLADVSHELRSPLARMNVALALLRERGDDPVTRDARIDNLETDVVLIDRLVGEVLLVSRFDLGAVPVRAESLAVTAVLHDAWRQTSGAGGVTAPVLDLGPRATHMAADPSLVARIFRNLLENAVRYADGSAVTVATRRRDDRVEVTVADGGPGVAQALRERLFEPFFRVDRARTPQTNAQAAELPSGIGLGLMIVRRAVEAHGGQVRAERATTGGLAVVFDLPADAIWATAGVGCEGAPAAPCAL